MSGTSPISQLTVARKGMADGRRRDRVFEVEENYIISRKFTS
jgi:hypothetical protein